jgi:hypothetical protein
MVEERVNPGNPACASNAKTSGVSFRKELLTPSLLALLQPPINQLSIER